MSIRARAGRARCRDALGAPLSARAQAMRHARRHRGRREREAADSRARSASTRRSASSCRSTCRSGDEHGRDVTLGEYFGARPVVLALAYYECPMLCTQVLNGMTGALKTLSFDAGKDFDVVVVSIDPKDDADAGAPRRRRPTSSATAGRRPRRGWHFLTGTEASIKPLAEAIGFRYALRREHQAVRARRGDLRRDAEGRRRALSSRHRVRAARPPPGAGRGVEQPARLGRSTRCCCSATTTTRRPASTASAILQRRPPRRSSRRSPDSWRSCSSACGASGAAEGRRGRDSYLDACSRTFRSFRSRRPSRPRQVDALYFFLVAVTAFFAVLDRGPGRRASRSSSTASTTTRSATPIHGSLALELLWTSSRSASRW